MSLSSHRCTARRIWRIREFIGYLCLFAVAVKSQTARQHIERTSTENPMELSLERMVIDVNASTQQSSLTLTQSKTDAVKIQQPPSNTFRCGGQLCSSDILHRLKGPKGDKGLQGPPGVEGEEGYCPIPTCPRPQYIIEKGPVGLEGICSASCPSLTPGSPGLQGEKGDPGPDAKVDNQTLEKKIENILNSGGRQLFLRNWTTSDEGVQKRRIRRRTRRSVVSQVEEYESRIDSRRKALGLIILNDVKELKTLGNDLPLGAIVATYLYDSFRHTGDLPPMGMFVKTNTANNQWNRVPVTFEKEVTYGNPPSEATEIGLSSSQLQLVLAFYPYPVSGAEFLGWYGADTLCRETAERRLGVPGFRVFLSDRNLPIEQILPWRLTQVPVINLAGSLLFRELKDLFYGTMPYSSEPLYDLNGTPYTTTGSQRKFFWFGAGREYSCDFWSSNDTDRWGLIWTLDHERRLVTTSYAQCSNPNYILCYKLMRRSAA